jgi:phosphatidylglycerophosphate synthase
MGGLGLYFVLKNSTVSSSAYLPCFAYNMCNISTFSKTFTISMFDISMLIASIFLIAGTCAMSYAKARGEIVGVSTVRGLMQRQERIVLLGLFMVLFPFIKVICDNNDWNSDYMLAGLLVLMTVLVNFSAIVRMVDVFSKIKKIENNNN